MTALEIIKELCEEKGVTIKKMEQDIGISANSSFKWKNSNPSAKALQKLSQYFGVSTEYILTGDESKRKNFYDDETEQIAIELQKNKELRAIFDVAKVMPKERLDAFYNLLKDLK